MPADSVVFDRGNQQPLGIIWRRRDNRFQTRNMGEQRLRALAVGLPAKDPAAEGRSHRHRRDEFARRPIAQPRRFGDQLIQPRIDVIGELDFRHRAQSVSSHADSGPDDPAFVDRRIEHAGLAMLLLQAMGCAEHAAEITDVLAKHDHIGIAGQHDVERIVDRLDHVETADGGFHGTHKPLLFRGGVGVGSLIKAPPHPVATKARPSDIGADPSLTAPPLKGTGDDK